MRVAVQLVPDPRGVPREATAVIVDVLRATTTLTVALNNGAARVLPVASPEDGFALALRERHALLCGERGGRRIPGYDLGNSPAEYGPDVVSGRTLIFASTNGSPAMLGARAARRRVLGAFVNLAAVADAVSRETRVVIVCAGKEGASNLEDTACAGLLVARLAARGAELEDGAARLALSHAPADAAAITALLQGASHGRYLRSLGPEFARDLERCADLDSIDRAFQLD